MMILGLHLRLDDIISMLPPTFLSVCQSLHKVNIFVTGSFYGIWVYNSVTTRARMMILGLHLHLDYIISVPPPLYDPDLHFMVQ